MNETCVCCGEVIPEGRQVCSSCIKQIKEYKVDGAKTITFKKFVMKGVDHDEG